MLCSTNSRNNTRVYNLRSNQGTSRTKLRQKLLKATTQRLNRNLRNRNRKVTSKREHSNLKLDEILGKEIVTQVQYNSQNQFPREIVRTVQPLYEDKVMQVVEIIDESPRLVKTVKFEQYLDADIVPKSTKNKSSLQNLRSYLKTKRTYKGSSRRSRSRQSLSSRRSSKPKAILGQARIVKQVEKHLKLFKDDSRNEYSRPNSVTSLFTACSAGNLTNTHKFGSNFDLINTMKDDTLSSLGEREVVECIEDTYLPTGHQVRNEHPPLRTRSKTRGYHQKKMSLISEIQSDLENSGDMSLDEPYITPKVPKAKKQAPKPIRKVKFETVSFKTAIGLPVSSSCTASSSNSESTKKSFKCYKESDVMKFIDVEPVKLPYNLSRGDDDEDSEEEDIKGGRKYLQQHLEKCLSMLLH